MISLIFVLVFVQCRSYVLMNLSEYTLTIQPDNTTAQDSEQCGTSQIPCKTVEYTCSVRAIDPDIRLWKIRLVKETVCSESKVTLVDKDITVSGDSIECSLYGLANIAPMETVFHVQNSLSLDTLTLTRNRLCGVLTIKNGGDATISNCLLLSDITSPAQWKNGFGSMFVNEDGDLSISNCTLNIITPKQTFCLLSLKGGKTNFGTVEAGTDKLTLLGSQSLINQTGGSLSIKDQKFLNIQRISGAAAILESSSSWEAVILRNVSFNSCSSPIGACSVFISRSTEFTEGSVVFHSVHVHESSTDKLIHIILSGHSLSATVTAESFHNTIPAYVDLTKDHILAFRGRNEAQTTSFPLALFLFPYSEGDVYVSDDCDDHEFCGLKKLPCNTFAFGMRQLHGDQASLVMECDEIVKHSLVAKEGVFSIRNGFEDDIASLVFYKDTKISVPAKATLTIRVIRLKTTINTDNALLHVTGGTLALEETIIELYKLTTEAAVVVDAGAATLRSVELVTTSTTMSCCVLMVNGGTGHFISSKIEGSPESINSANRSFFEHFGGNMRIESSFFRKLQRNEGFGGVVMSVVESGSLSIVDCQFTECMARSGGQVLYIERLHSPFDVGNLMVANCYVPDALNDLTDTFILVGEDFGVPVAGGSFASTLPEYDDIRPADVFRFTGRVSPASTPISLLYFDNAYAEGDLFVKTGYFDHPSCGLKRLPCDTLAYGLERVKGNGKHTVHVEGMLELNTTVYVRQNLHIDTSNTTTITINISQKGSFVVEESASPETTVQIHDLNMVFHASTTDTAIFESRQGHLVFFYVSFHEMVPMDTPIVRVTRGTLTLTEILQLSVGTSTAPTIHTLAGCTAVYITQLLADNVQPGWILIEGAGTRVTIGEILPDWLTRHEFEEQDLCHITTPFVRISNSSVTVTNATFLNANLGAFELVNCTSKFGFLKIHGSSTGSPTFPDMARNVHCTGGSMSVATLVLNSKQPPPMDSLWIEADGGCVVIVAGENVVTPMFVPSLTTWTVRIDGKKLNMQLEGTNLYPCGIQLEIADLSSKNTQHWTPLSDATFTFIFHSSTSLCVEGSTADLPFSPSSLWKGSVVFGADQQARSTAIAIDITGFVSKSLLAVLIAVPTTIVILIIPIVILVCVKLRKRFRDSEWISILDDAEGINTADSEPDQDDHIGIL
ncbi:hypothetical protein BLNAU_19435 [Blattamonas nauphoetae]|uniref:Uncharacterized protein n=1 Tax=Blattamonas nauphoetae TaxID=2049346 RepID=A0ABQ9X1I4_9EUKA|nr:hypothetical protein BLNAU_19435 [Blattamonas nauphoetae]